MARRSGRDRRLVRRAYGHRAAHRDRRAADDRRRAADPEPRRLGHRPRAGNVVGGLNVDQYQRSGITGANVGTLALSDFDVTVTGGTALSLTTSGTVTATGADNDLNAANNTALNVNAVTIGASRTDVQEHLGRQCHRGGDPVNGIVLSNTGRDRRADRHR